VRAPLRRAAAHRWGRVAAGLLAALAVLVPAGSASAAGTGGIEVTPLPVVQAGKQVTAFHVPLPGSGQEQVTFLLHNVEDDERTARVYVASATQVPGGGYDVAGPDSSSYVAYAPRTVTLAAREQRTESFEVSRPYGDRTEGPAHAALVVEVTHGAVVQRAATLIYLEAGPRLPVPLPLLAVAVLLLLAAGAGLVLGRAGLRRGSPALPAVQSRTS
jgi:hypothetical protein